MKYKCGYGLCKDDFTIEQVELAAFVDENDAYQYIRMKSDNSLSDNNIYYVDGSDGRHFFDTRHREFVTDINKLSIWGYEVYGEYESPYEYGLHEEDMDVDIEKCSCISRKKAEEIKGQYYNQGVSYAYIVEAEIDVADVFWNIQDFAQSRTDRIIEEMER